MFVYIVFPMEALPALRVEPTDVAINSGKMLAYCSTHAEKTAPLSQGSPPLEPTMLVAERVTRSLLKDEGEKEE